LKEEYTKLNGKEIGELRKKGVEINYDLKSKMFVYLGDTSKEIFDDKEWEKIVEYPTIIIECTFILKEEREQAIKTHHIHWDFIEPVVEKYNKNTFILIHFSQRYDKSEIKNFLKKKRKTM
jgi:ribonuclease Z